MLKDNDIIKIGKYSGKLKMKNLPLDYIKYFKDVFISAENKDVVEYCKLKHINTIIKNRKQIKFNKPKDNSIMETKIAGTIVVVGETETVGKNDFKKRELVLNTGGDYPQFMSIQFNKDNCERLDGYAVGEQISVDVNLRGNKWTNKDGKDVYFNSLIGWRIEDIAAENQAEQAAAPVGNTSDGDDDLPF